MRRPLKPFVTEYKSPNRKTKDLFETPPGTPTLEQEQPAAPAAVRAFSPPTDSYEEALRAADALFGGQAARHVPEVAPKATEHPQGGRILRAIEETAPDPFAQLEAERAPKRRGRKPGSKNRPKLPLAATHVALLPPAVAPVETRRKPIVAPEPQVEVTRERFAWVRTKLRPGEQWKRRLPKVAW